MRNSLCRVLALALLAAVAGPETAGAGRADEPVQLAQGCGFYVILGCFRAYGDAEQQANRIGARVVDTNSYPNFSNGWYCAADGPFSSKGAAEQRKQSWRGTVRDAYAKSAC